MTKYIWCLLTFHFCFVSLSYILAESMPDEEDQTFLMNWFYFQALVFIVWLPLYLYGLEI